MRRRNFIALLGCAAAWPAAARAQQGERVRRIGVLTAFPEDDKESQTRLTAFRRKLARLGWIEGRNVLIDYRWLNGDPVRAKLYAKELIALSPVYFSPAAVP